MIPAQLMPALGNFAGGLGKGLGDAIGGGGGPMSSGSGLWDMRSAFDGSGWTVSTGGGTTTGGARTGGTDMGSQPAGVLGGTGLAQQAGLGWISMLLLVGVAVYWFSRGGKF